jgi:hypothetical protein
MNHNETASPPLYPHAPRRAEATGPPLRTQGSLSRCWVVSSSRSDVERVW